MGWMEGKTQLKRKLMKCRKFRRKYTEGSMERQKWWKNTERNRGWRKEVEHNSVGDLKGEKRNNAAKASIRKDCCYELYKINERH